jgi:hypothetical protein
MEFLCLLLAVAMILCVLSFFSVNALVKRRQSGELEGPACPWCRRSLPVLRKPKTARQLFFGGWICPHCEAESDRWGQLLRPGRTEHPGARQQSRL